MGNACYYSVEKLLLSNLLSINLKVRIYKTVILPVVLYGCETWTLSLIEKHRLSAFDKKVLRKIFGAKRVEVTGELRKLHNTELHALYSSPGIIKNIKSRRLRWAGHVARMGESRNSYIVLVGKPEGKRPLGRRRLRWEDNIKMDLREVEYADRDWLNLCTGYGPMAGLCEGGNDPTGFFKAISEFREMFHKAPPSTAVLLQAVDKFRLTGSVLTQRKGCTGRPVTVTNNDNHRWLVTQVLQSSKRRLWRRFCRARNIAHHTHCWNQASLPIKFGGVGIRKLSDVCIPAFLSSAFGVFRCIKSLFPLYSDATEICHVCDAQTSWHTSSQTTHPPAHPEFQKQWDVIFSQKNLDKLLSSFKSEQDIARLLAFQESESGAWLHALPSPHIGTLIDSTSFKIAIALRLGCKLCQPHQCICGGIADIYGHHALSCARSKDRIPRHTSLNDIIKRSLTSCGIPSLLEPPGISRADGKRPDGLTLIPWSRGKSLIWDSTCIDTLAPSHLPNTCRRAAFAAELAHLLDNISLSPLLETETLPHILGFCPYSEALRNIRHHAVRSMLGEALKEVGFTVHQEVQGLATQGSVRRIDIIAIKNNSAYILDPTIRFETHADQPHEVDSEKKRIYEPTIPFYKDKYSLSHIDVIGLMVGARDLRSFALWEDEAWCNGRIETAFSLLGYIKHGHQTIERRRAIAKEAFNRKRRKVLCVECGIVRDRNMDITTKWRETNRRFEMWIWRGMEHVKWIDRIRNETMLERVGEERMKLKLIRNRKRNWLNHWLRRNCIVKEVLEGMVNGRNVRGRRRYQMIDDIKIWGVQSTRESSPLLVNWEIFLLYIP
ncbi:hypothetical protein ANN_24409 [Periplaneta americana]|uniref:Reverse transcriptase n=1 Tax=Periplaneta americana TaxID=6978 RepID=A0ABQ8S3C1_PERAM|nr:hypothetical protein ANN_24409 [Periplaneta americana]